MGQPLRFRKDKYIRVVESQRARTEPQASHTVGNGTADESAARPGSTFPHGWLLQGRLVVRPKRE